MMTATYALMLKEWKFCSSTANRASYSATGRFACRHLPKIALAEKCLGHGDRQPQETWLIAPPWSPRTCPIQRDVGHLLFPAPWRQLPAATSGPICTRAGLCSRRGTSHRPGLNQLGFTPASTPPSESTRAVAQGYSLWQPIPGGTCCTPGRVQEQAKMVFSKINQFIYSQSSNK